MIPDGVFADSGAGLAFVELPPPSDEEVEALCIDIARRIVKRGHAFDAASDEDDELATLAAAHDECLRLPLPERPGVEPRKRSRCALVAGFSLDANTSCAAHDRAALERLLRYGLRPPFAQSRLSITPRGKVACKLSRPWYTGQTGIVLEPLAFMKRLAALIPPPRQNQVRFHGLVAPHAKQRAAFVELAGGRPDLVKSGDGESDGAFTRRKRIAWAKLLKHVFESEVLVCPDCQGPRKIIAAITRPDGVEKILTHLGVPTEPPALAPARAPPQIDFYDDGWVPEHTLF